MMAIALFMMKDETFYPVKLGAYNDTMYILCKIKCSKEDFFVVLLQILCFRTDFVKSFEQDPLIDQDE